MDPSEGETLANYVLYSTLGCHLCEQAETILASLSKHYALAWRTVDIADSDELIDRYGLRIPVLKHAATGSEIGWPFDEQTLAAWLEQRA